MTEVLKTSTDGPGIFAIEECSSKFGFGGTGYNLTHDVTEDMNRTVGARQRCVVGGVISEGFS